MDDDENQPRTDEIDSQYIRYPPKRGVLPGQLELTDTVDAFHNDAWWVASVVPSKAKAKAKAKAKSKSKSEPKPEPMYTVNLWSTHEELEFKCSDLRVHQD